MKTTSLMAGASRFAHFAGLTRSASRQAAEDDDQRDTDAEDDEDGKAASEDDDKPSGKRSSRARRAEEEDDDDGEDADDDDDGKEASEDDEDKPSGKRSSRARHAADDDDGKDADDDDKQEMSGKSAAACARRRERARVATILSSPHAANNPVLAVSLACDTTMTRKEAIAVLKGQQGVATSGSDRSSRSARNADLGAIAGGGEQPKAKAGSSWDRSLKKLGINPRG